MVLMVVRWRYGMPFDTNGCLPKLMNVDWIKWMYFSVDEFEVGINDSIFSGNEQQKVLIPVLHLLISWVLKMILFGVSFLLYYF